MSAGRRILIVDDDPYTRDLTATALRGEGYEVVGAARLQQGLEAARAQRPHLLLCDVVLPDGSGVDLARAIRHELPEREVPVTVLMSAFSKGRLADQHRMKAEAKAVAFLTKPLSLPAVVDLVRQHLPLSVNAASGPEGPASRPAAAASPAAAEPPLPGTRPAALVPPAPVPAVTPGQSPAPAPARSEAPASAGASVLLALTSAWRKGWTGTLTITGSEAGRTIVVERGQVVGCTSDLAGTPAPETEGVVLEVLGWPEGSYRVAATAGRPAHEERAVPTPTPRLVLRAFREVISTDRVDARLRLPGETPVARRPDVPAAALAQLGPTTEESRFLDALREAAPVPEQLGRHPGGPEAAAPFLAALLALGIVDAASRPDARVRAADRAGNGSGPPALGRAPRPAEPASPPPPSASQRQAAEAAARRLLEAEAAFEAARSAAEREDLATAQAQAALAVTLCPEEGEYRAFAAWVRALAARAAFDAALDAAMHEMEEALPLTASPDAVQELMNGVARLRGA